jgi:hypothetical protein
MVYPAPDAPGRFGRVVYGRRPPVARPAHIHALLHGPSRFGGLRPGDSTTSLRALSLPRRPMSTIAPLPAPVRRLTHLQSGTMQLVSCKNLTATSTVASVVPSNYGSALADPNWRAAMADEFQAVRHWWITVPSVLFLVLQELMSLLGDSFGS